MAFSDDELLLSILEVLLDLVTSLCLVLNVYLASDFCELPNSFLSKFRKLDELKGKPLIPNQHYFLLKLERNARYFLLYDLIILWEHFVYELAPLLIQ